MASNPIKQQIRGLAGVAGRMALGAVRRRVEQTTRQLTDFAENGGMRTVGQLAGAEGRFGRVKGLAKMAFGGLKAKLGFGGRGAKGKKLKFLNIVESLDIGAPVRVVYNQWTQFQDWPSFMKKVEKVVQDEDAKLTFQAKIFWSRRSWQSTITEQVPDEKIIWRSQGAKGYVDGSVTFHEVTPDLTRVLVVLEYHPKGFMEHVGKIWRAQGRRARLEFKHFRRHVMIEDLLHPDDVEGWRGVIHEGEVVKDHETALREEEEQEREREQRAEGGRPEEAEDEYEEAEEREEPEEGEEGEEAEEAEDEYEEGEEPEEEEERPRRRAVPEQAQEERRRRRLPWSPRRGERPEAGAGEPRGRERRPERGAEEEPRRRGTARGEREETGGRREEPRRHRAEGREEPPRRGRRAPAPEPRGRGR
ncbi:SRPBCC family protein [Sphaerisporangium melleum]|uniref:SRPBCC family protein n=1 Tax=Sphaerisporangium melleum TaxID=321316 RepID=UPI001E4445C1|nr:SRPBCC family protein [Sphaerisporangium melleum]